MSVANAQSALTVLIGVNAASAVSVVTVENAMTAVTVVSEVNVVSALVTGGGDAEVARVGRGAAAMVGDNTLRVASAHW